MQTYLPVICAVIMTASAALQWDIVFSRNRWFKKMLEEYGADIIAQVPKVHPAPAYMYIMAIFVTLLALCFWLRAFWLVLRLDDSV